MTSGPFFDSKFAPPIVALGPWTLGVAIALITPDDILSHSAWLRQYAAWFADLFPYMRRAAAYSAFPDVTLFFHAVMWTIAPIWLVVWLQIKPDPKLYERQRKHKWFFLFSIVLFACVIIYVPYFLMFTSEDITRSERIMSYSRLGLGLTGTVTYAGGVVAYMYIFSIWIRRIPALYFGQPD